MIAYLCNTQFFFALWVQENDFKCPWEVANLFHSPSTCGNASKHFFSSQDTPTALQLLFDAELARKAELQKFYAQPDFSDSGNETDSQCPVYDLFFREQGSTVSYERTNFTSSKFNALWNGEEASIRAKWSNHKKHRNVHTTKDIVFLVTTTLKHGITWERCPALKG